MKQIKIIFILFLLLVVSTVKGQLNENIDLNFDNKVDKIQAEKYENSLSFKLTINDASIEGKFNGGELEDIKIVDINKWDKYKEVILHTSGPSNDDEHMIYWYDGKEIKFIDNLTRWPEFTGNGIFYLDNWEGFWSSRDKYVLNNDTRKFIKVDQYAYYVGKELQIGTGFKIYKEEDLKTEVALLSDSSTVMLILCNKENRSFFDYRFLLKTNSGLLGWSDFRTIQESKPIPMAD